MNEWTNEVNDWSPTSMSFWGNNSNMSFAFPAKPYPQVKEPSLSCEIYEDEESWLIRKSEVSSYHVILRSLMNPICIKNAPTSRRGFLITIWTFKLLIWFYILHILITILQFDRLIEYFIGCPKKHSFVP